MNRTIPVLIVGAVLFFSSASAQSIYVNTLPKEEVTAEKVNNRYRLKASRENHPQLFFNNSDVQRIKSLLKAKDPFITIGYDSLHIQADRYLKSPLINYSLDDAKLRIPTIHKFADQVPVLVLMYRITGEKKYADKCIAQLKHLVTYPDWGANRHFLDAGIGAFLFAFAYDGLFDVIDANLKIDLRKAVLKNILVPGKQQIEKKEWWYISKNNWNGICNGGLIMAALAMYEEDPAFLAPIIATAANGLPMYLQSFDPDGQSEEGLWYWIYGQTYTLMALEAMQHTLGTDFGVSDYPGFKKTGWFPFYMSGPVTSLSIGDDAVKDHRMPSFFWYARQFNDWSLAKMQYDLCLENKSVSWSDLLSYDPSLVKGASAKITKPTSYYIHGIELMSIRENWEKNSLFVSMHGGSNTAGHAHLDAGSFDLQGIGKVWAYGNLGPDKYVYPGYFSLYEKPGYEEAVTPPEKAGRWHFYRLRAEGKNCVVFNPDTRPDQNPLGEAKMLGDGHKNEVDSFVVDLTDCYKRDVNNYHRTIKMNKKDRVITVEDSIKATHTNDVWWNMHTKALISLSQDKRTAILKLDDKKMTAKISSPSNAIFQVMSASYLPGENFPLTKNSSNDDFKKLAIQLKDTKNVVISVEFRPVLK